MSEVKQKVNKVSNETEKETPILPCPHCGGTNIIKGYWWLENGEVDAYECVDCDAGAPVSTWQKRSQIKGHVIAAMANELTAQVPAYAQAQCLRGIISKIVIKHIKNNTTSHETHEWDKCGERCLKCGDKDWFASKECDGAKIKDMLTRKPKNARPHININGQFQSDKYPTTPPDLVPLKITDPMARDLLFIYADRRRIVDFEFSEDLLFRLLDN